MEESAAALSAPTTEDYRIKALVNLTLELVYTLLHNTYVKIPTNTHYHHHTVLYPLEMLVPNQAFPLAV